MRTKMVEKRHCISCLLLHKNYHKLNSLKQHLFIILHFSIDQASGQIWLVLQLRVSQGWNWSVGRSTFLSGGSTGAESTSKLLRVWAEFSFLLLEGWGLVPHWLLTLSSLMPLTFFSCGPHSLQTRNDM